MALDRESLRKPDIGFIPTEMEAIAAMFELVEASDRDILYDLGCGDGRVVIAAAQTLGMRGVGVDIDPDRLRSARENAERTEVSHLVEFRQQDLYEADFREATIVFLYLLPHLNLRLLPNLLRQLKPGSRIVSHDFEIGSWQPDRTLHLDTPEEPTLYCWIMPEQVCLPAVSGSAE